MWTFDIGAVPVVDDRGRIVGMVTDRGLAVAGIMAKNKIRHIPVVDERMRQLGMVSLNDLVLAKSGELPSGELAVTSPRSASIVGRTRTRSRALTTDAGKTELDNFCLERRSLLAGARGRWESGCGPSECAR